LKKKKIKYEKEQEGDRSQADLPIAGSAATIAVHHPDQPPCHQHLSSIIFRLEM
jgi:hypothetical protein